MSDRDFTFYVHHGDFPVFHPHTDGARRWIQDHLEFGQWYSSYDQEPGLLVEFDKILIVQEAIKRSGLTI